MVEPRQILFRAKPKDWKTNPLSKNRWFEGYYLKKQDTTYCFKEDYEKFPVETRHYIAVEEMTDWGLPNEFRYFEIDPETLCEFTGMYDKENNKIWENNILETEYGRLCMVYWFSSNNYCGWDLKPIKTIDNIAYSAPRKSCVFCSEYNEVIGNIFDNSELAKEKINDKTIM